MMYRGNFPDFFMESMLPALRSVSMDSYRMKKKMMPALFNVETSEKSIEQYSQVTGFGLAIETPEGEDIRTDERLQGFDSLFKHRKYALGAETTQELVDDDKIGLIRRNNIELGLSISETVEIDAASTFNNAFNGSFTGPDGVSLCSANHPLVKAGGVQSNVLSVPADLDVTSLELALTDYELMKRSDGKQMSLPTARLLVAAQNRWNANEILKGTWRSDTANHTVNAFKYAENGPVDQVLVWSKLTDPDAWFLVAPPESTYLVWFWRKRPQTDGDYDRRKQVGQTFMFYRKSHGWWDFYGVYGTPGA